MPQLKFKVAGRPDLRQSLYLWTSTPNMPRLKGESGNSNAKYQPCLRGHMNCELETEYDILQEASILHNSL
jgi:hypothetical protein